MNCINCAEWNGGLICVRKCSPEKAVRPVVQTEKRRFSMWYRLNSRCDWQPAMPLGSDLETATLALLLAVKTIYRIGSKDIEIVEKLGGTPLTKASGPGMNDDDYEYPYGRDYCGI